MYKLTNNTSITRLPDNASIPQYEGNADYREYLAWLAEGNTPEPADLVRPVPAQSQIDQIERDTIMNRAVREFFLLSAEAQALAKGVSQPQLYAANIAYKKIKDIDSQIAILRGQI